MHARHFIFILIGIQIVASTPAGADPPEAFPRTLDEYIQLALTRNPALAAAGSGAAAAAEHRGVIRAFPDPVLSGGYFASTPETRVGPQEWSVGLTQRLPFFGKRGLQGNMAEGAATVAASDYERQRLDVIFDVTRAYHEYYRLIQIQRTLEDESELVQRMQEVAQVKYASGQVGQQDVLKAQLSLSKIEDDLTMNARMLTTTRVMLNELLGRAPGAGLPEPERYTPSIDTLMFPVLSDTAVARRPELAAAAGEVDRTRAARELASRQYWPDLTVGIHYTGVGERDVAGLADNGKDILLLSAGINLPLWFGGRQATVRQADADIARAESAQRAAELRVRSQATDAVEKVRTAHERLDLYENVIVPQAEHTFEAAEAGYRTGVVDFLTYLDSQRELLSVRKRYYDVVADLGVQIAYLDRVAGESPAGRE